MVSQKDYSTGNKALDEKLEDWFAWNQNTGQNDEVKEMLGNGNTKELERLFTQRIEFGTAGLRGRMGPGFSQMNDLVIIQTAQGLLSYLSADPEPLRERGIVIGYDGRHNSRRFADLTAGIFLSWGAPVYLFSKVCPTPFVPFAVVKYGCVAGVMVTASHNPKEDNGYKVYWGNGAQIVSPTDKGIKEAIEANLKPREGSWKPVLTSGQLHDPLEIVTVEYSELVVGRLYDQKMNSSSPRITYTAMHGVGWPYVKHVFKAANLKELVPVEEQVGVDPEFPTVKFPNPEEGKSSLDLSMRTADSSNCPIILANDPDADRLALAEKNRNGEWKVFSGNEMGALLGWWELHCQRHSKPEELPHCYFISSTVSSKILKTMAEAEGLNFEETLTGFKWMGNKAYELIKKGKKVLFAFEEAIGFMCGTGVLDKDGVSASVRMAELATFCYEKEKITLAEKLNNLYKKYGHHVSENSYYICDQPAVIKRIFDRIRNFNGPNTYPEEICDGKFKVVGVRDLTTGFDSTKPDKKAILPVSSSSQMITLTFNNGLVATLRTSGTEPKIKYYTELCASPDQQNVEDLRASLLVMVKSIISNFLQPEVNNLVERTL